MLIKKYYPTYERSLKLWICFQLAITDSASYFPLASRYFPPEIVELHEKSKFCLHLQVTDKVLIKIF